MMLGFIRLGDMPPRESSFRAVDYAQLGTL